MKKRKKLGLRTKFIKTATLNEIAARAYDAHNLASVHDPDLVKAVYEIVKHLKNESLTAKIARLI